MGNLCKRVSACCAMLSTDNESACCAMWTDNELRTYTATYRNTRYGIFVSLQTETNHYTGVFRKTNVYTKYASEDAYITSANKSLINQWIIKLESLDVANKKIILDKLYKMLST